MERTKTCLQEWLYSDTHLQPFSTVVNIYQTGGRILLVNYSKDDKLPCSRPLVSFSLLVQ